MIGEVIEIKKYKLSITNSVYVEQVIENHYLKHVKGIKDIIGKVIEMQKSVRVK